jgi:hypothetical protein
MLYVPYTFSVSYILRVPYSFPTYPISFTYPILFLCTLYLNYIPYLFAYPISYYVPYSFCYGAASPYGGYAGLTGLHDTEPKARLQSYKKIDR